MIEKQIEDLCLEKAKQMIISASGYSIQGDVRVSDFGSLADAELKSQIARARIQAIDSQLDELRNKLAEKYKQEAKDKEVV